MAPRDGLADRPTITGAVWRARLDGWDPPPRVVVLFGSAAGGTMQPSSDIDLLVVVPAAPTTMSATSSRRPCRTPRGGPATDARVLLVREEDVSGDEPALVGAADDGVVVHGDDAWFRRTVERVRSPPQGWDQGLATS